jgi:hypothetical protein
MSQNALGCQDVIFVPLPVAIGQLCDDLELAGEVLVRIDTATEAASPQQNSSGDSEQRPPATVGQGHGRRAGRLGPERRHVRLG